MAETVVGIIGGSGLYELSKEVETERVEVETPFGPPSSPLTVAILGNVRLIFLARHGEGHRLLPGEINYRANIFALKTLKVRWVISVSAVGSLRAELRPGHLVVPSQALDFTRRREQTFFGDGICAHVAFADPFCPVLSEVLFATACEVSSGFGVQAHDKATYVCIEGPMFSTRAESHYFRSLGGDIIGMTNFPEARLAREAEMSYGTLGLVTDYDCWRDEREDVEVSAILELLKRNVVLAKDVLKMAVPLLAKRSVPSQISQALDSAILTPSEALPQSTKSRLGPILARYLSGLQS